MNNLTIKICCLVVICCFLGGTPQKSRRSTGHDAAVNKTAIQKLPLQHISNAIRLHPQLISGAGPTNANGFRELSRLGVKTVISVDGSRPDVKLAKQFGLRYVHLPHGYDRIKPSRVREIARAIHELPGPVFIHCHHGRHRGPAAATAAGIVLGFIPHKQADAILKVAGTGPQYTGLFRSVRTTRRLSIAEIESVDVTFQEFVKPPPFVDVMTRLAAIFEQLENHPAAKNAQSKPDSQQTQAHNALLLEELFVELQRDPTVKSRPQEFRNLLSGSEQSARRLHAAFKSKSVEPELVRQQLRKIRQDCSKCHNKFRVGSE